MKYCPDKFSSSFWPASISVESIPNYKLGTQVLYDTLFKSVSENETIIDYLQKRIDTERQCAELFIANLTPAMSMASESVESSMNASLKSSFDIVCQEHTDIAHGHEARAQQLQQQVLAPLVDFTTDFKHQLETKYSHLISNIEEFEHASQTALMTRSVYWSRCHLLEVNHPDFRPPVPPGFQEDDNNNEDNQITDFVVGGGRQRSSSVASEWNVDQGGVRLGTYTVLPYREVARSITRMEKMIESKKISLTSSARKYLGKDIFDWVRDYCVSPPPPHEEVNLDTEAQDICHHLVALKFLKAITAKQGFDLNGYYQVQHNIVERYLRKTRIRQSIDYGPMDNNEESLTLEVPSSNNNSNMINGFLDRINILKKNSVDPTAKAQLEMNEADDAYKKKIKSVDGLRKKLEENMIDYFDEMEEIEKKRVEKVKHAFITLASVLNDNSNNSTNKTYHHITLVQETLKPEQDIQYIVEQLKTGFYCPKPMLYENYYYGTAINQTFGVPLEEIAQIHGSFVPPLINKGLRMIEGGFTLKKGEQSVEEVWTQLLPVKDINKICEQVDGLAGSKLQETLEHKDHCTIANLIRMYLLELPECLLTFDLYEPVKILYNASQQHNNNHRLVSVSKLLATLPSPNYHTLKAFSHHLFKLLKSNKNNESFMNDIIQSFSYVLLRPQIFSSINMYDQHPKRLLRDILTQYDAIFTKDNNRAQRSSASRSAIVADTMESPHESNIRRTPKNIMVVRRSSHDEPEEVNSPVLPHPKITLFEDPEHSEPTPMQSGASTPVIDKLQEEDKVDIKRLSNDLELILNLEGQDDAVEINGKDDIERKVLSPTKTPVRSRASTRGTLDNVELDPFFDD